MSKRKKKSQSHALPVLSSPELIAVRLLFFVALAISVYLALSSWKAGGVPGCGPQSDCDKVLSSRWASLFGIPVSFLALPVYSATFASLFGKNLPWRFLTVIATTVLIMALWFVGLQMFALRAFCKFCMTAHLAGALASIILLRKAPLLGRASLGPVTIAAAASLIMITAQTLSRPPAPVQVSTANPSQANASKQSETNSIATPAAPTFTILEGQVTLDLTKVPVSGELDAKHKFIKLFDYTCHHCRGLHHLLEPVKHSYSNKVAIVSLPMPLDANCNPIIKSTPRSHENACEYAKLALAVFFAEPAKFEQYSNWLFHPPRPPELSAAREHAARLVTQEKLNVALTDPRIPQQLKQNSDIFVSSSRLARRSTLPQLIFPGGVSVGGVTDAQQLNKILFDGLGLGAEAASSNR